MVFFEKNVSRVEFELIYYLQIYDKEFKLIREIDRINNEKFHPKCLTSNGKNSIFITDVIENEIIKTDFNFNFVKRFKSTDLTIQELKCPYGITYYENSIFVCDSDELRIQRFTEDLVFKKSYPLNFKPCSIQIVNNIACIEYPNGLASVGLFNLEPFSFIKLIENVEGPITAINSWFYIYNYKFKSIQCYNINGDIVEKKDIEINENFLTGNYPLSLGYINKRMIIGTSKTLIILREI